MCKCNLQTIGKFIMQKNASRRKGGGLLCLPTHTSVGEQISDYAEMLAGYANP